MRYRRSSDKYRNQCYKMQESKQKHFTSEIGTQTQKFLLAHAKTKALSHQENQATIE